MFTVLTQVIISLMGAAAIILLTTWKGSPVPLPLPAEPQRRWLRPAPVLATAAIIGILSTLFTDCLYLNALLATILISVSLCLGLMVLHHHLLNRVAATNTIFIILCFGWSISGTLAISSLGSLVIAKRQMDLMHSQNPLRLSQSIGDSIRQPDGPIYVTANLPVHLQARVQECRDNTVDWTIYPAIGSIQNGTYLAPAQINQQQQITITATSHWYQDKQSATITLLPDAADIKRQQYTGEDEQKRQALFDVIVISSGHSWVFGSDVYIESNKTSLDHGSQKVIPVCDPVLLLAKSYGFDPYADVIAIGTASREGTRAEEDNRADRRSKRLAEWVNLALSKKVHSKNVYAMNLGQYQLHTGDTRRVTKDETAPERPVVLIGIVRSGPINIKQALHDVFSRNQDNELFRFLDAHYPKRDIIGYSNLPSGDCGQ
jgi:hypothetical protein